MLDILKKIFGLSKKTEDNQERLLPEWINYDLAEWHEKIDRSDKPRDTRIHFIEATQKELPPEIEKLYHKNFSRNGKKLLFYEKISPRIANQYAPQFFATDIVELVKANCPRDIAIGYCPRFFQLSEINHRDFTTEIVREFVLLARGKVPPKEANKYENFKGHQIPVLYAAGITNEIVTPERRKLLNRLLINGIEFEMSTYGVGAYGAVLHSSGSAWKISVHIQKDYEILKRIQDKHQGKQKNVVKIKGEPVEGIALEMEPAGRDNLEEILKKYSKLSEDKVLKYGSQICNGIREMHEAGVYHRDLHDRNVLIDKYKGKAVIIDLGLATTNPKDIYDGNRAFGGNNDLISLGLLMYKMATGHNLFHDESWGLTADRKPEVKQEREKAYENNRQELKEKYFPKIKQNVKDPKIAGIILKLLNDELWTQPKIERVYEMQRMFREAA